MTAPATMWAVTATAHPALRGVRGDCEECLALTSAAVTHAAVTGSVGATHSNEPGGHSVTVARAVAVLHRPGDGDDDWMITVDSLTSTTTA